jgi:hypothetical protein
MYKESRVRFGVHSRAAHLPKTRAVPGEGPRSLPMVGDIAGPPSSCSRPGAALSSTSSSCPLAAGRVAIPVVGRARAPRDGRQGPGLLVTMLTSGPSNSTPGREGLGPVRPGRTGPRAGWKVTPRPSPHSPRSAEAMAANGRCGPLRERPLVLTHGATSPASVLVLHRGDVLAGLAGLAAGSPRASVAPSWPVNRNEATPSRRPFAWHCQPRLARPGHAKPWQSLIQGNLRAVTATPPCRRRPLQCPPCASSSSTAGRLSQAG